MPELGNYSAFIGKTIAFVQEPKRDGTHDDITITFEFTDGTYQEITIVEDF